MSYSQSIFRASPTRHKTSSSGRIILPIYIYIYKPTSTLHMALLVIMLTVAQRIHHMGRISAARSPSTNQLWAPEGPTQFWNPNTWYVGLLYYDSYLWFWETTLYLFTWTLRDSSYYPGLLRRFFGFPPRQARARWLPESHTCVRASDPFNWTLSPPWSATPH